MPHWVSLVRRCASIGQKPPSPMERDVLNITKYLNQFPFEDFANLLDPEFLEKVVQGHDVARLPLNGRTPRELLPAEARDAVLESCGKWLRQH
eukprot:1516466-Pyramimonas_sp.AAC.1